MFVDDSRDLSAIAFRTAQQLPFFLVHSGRQTRADREDERERHVAAAGKAS
jgi:hypothetical protein